METLLTQDCDNAGGVFETHGRGFMGEAIAEMLKTPLGVGNATYRLTTEDGYVDTVPFGCFKRELFERIGGFDERMTRNQDNELNFRIRKNGGKIYLNHNIRVQYYCRDTMRGIMKMGYMNGKWNVITMTLVRIRSRRRRDGSSCRLKSSSIRRSTLLTASVRCAALRRCRNS